MTATAVRRARPERPILPVSAQGCRDRGGGDHYGPEALGGVFYLCTAFGFFLLGGVLAMLLRGELAVPGLQFLSNEQYNQLFTMHGTIMLLLYATPIVFASPTTSCRCRSAPPMWRSRG